MVGFRAAALVAGMAVVLPVVAAWDDARAGADMARALDRLW